LPRHWMIPQKLTGGSKETPAILLSFSVREPTFSVKISQILIFTKRSPTGKYRIGYQRIDRSAVSNISGSLSTGRCCIISGSTLS
jgi:hypothetical protein